MDMKIIDKKDNKLVFTATIGESLANSIRRYVNEISILAIDTVEIFKNDSPLYDETLAHRVGLTPLKMEKVSDKEIVLKLSTNKEGYVYSKELKGEADVVYEGIPLTYLDKNQELELIAKTKNGKGKEHSKFSPGFIFYRHVADIKINKDCDNCKVCLDSCPQKILKTDGKKIIVEDVLKCDLCESCTDICKKHGKKAIEITPTDELMITIESFGQIEPKEIFNRSVKELKKDLNDFSKKLEKA
ncbi:MAG: DNA-directed RNA polymerase subunit D [archaeon]|nr:DNA-directed RNA polymerase subunit D [archaeon]